MDVLKVALAFLAAPAVVGVATWLSRRITKESRLLIRLERLAAVYAQLPPGIERDAFSIHVNELTRALSTRLDPIFRRERRLKRRATTAVYATAIAAVSLLSVFSLSSGTSNLPLASVIGVALGAASVAATWLIERDTKRQRAALEQESAGRAD